MATDCPPMTPVTSSNVAEIGHDGTALWIRFAGKRGEPGPLYRYPSAGQEHHAALLATDSPGRYILDRLKFFHPAEKVG
jgi:hypothetical protein